MPEDIDIWTINDRNISLHRETEQSIEQEELLKGFRSFCVEETTKSQLKEPGVKAELPAEYD